VFSLFNKPFFNKAEQQQIADAISSAEKKTSGEIRVFLEPKTKLEALHRAHDVFHELEMEKTEARNGVLIYLAYRDKQFAICGDKAIHEISGQAFWDDVAAEMKNHFSKQEMLHGVLRAIEMTGEKLQTFFPHQKNDNNELSDAPIIR